MRQLNKIFEPGDIIKFIDCNHIVLASTCVISIDAKIINVTPYNPYSLYYSIDRCNVTKLKFIEVKESITILEIDENDFKRRVTYIHNDSVHPSRLIYLNNKILDYKILTGVNL